MGQARGAPLRGRAQSTQTREETRARDGWGERVAWRPGARWKWALQGVRFSDFVAVDGTAQ